MIAGMKPLFLASALVFLSASPIAAQNQGSHSSGGHASVGAPSAQRGGGTFGSGGRVSQPATPSSSGRENAGHRPSQRFRNGYGYGASTMLPYDSEYDQMEGRGTFNDADAQETPDNRVGPTIFEHNGQLSSASAANYETRGMQREPAPDEMASEAATPAALTQTVLVFRDGHQQEVANYAIAGSKLIVLGEKTEKIQLNDLDLNATTKANEDRGVDFKMPGQS